MSKVSIIVPVYNPPEKYLEKCIESIVNQTFKDLDIILVDNESTGNCSDVLKKYAKKDSRINLIEFEKNKGFAGAVNEGIRQAKGEFLAIIDSDDWIEKNAIQILHDKLNNSDLDMTIYCSNVFDEKKQDFIDDPIYTFHQIPDVFNDSYFSYNDVKDFIFRFPMQAWNKFYRKSFIVDNNNFVDEELGSAGADAFFTFNNYLNAKKIGIVRDKLYNYRTNLGGGVVESLKQKNCKNFMFNFILFDKITNLLLSKKMKDDMAFPIMFVNIAIMVYFFEMLHVSHKHEYYKKMRIYLNNLNPDVYTETQMNKIDKLFRKKIARIKNNNYFMYMLKNFIYRKENYMNGHKNIIFNCSIYKVYQENNYKIKNILNLIRWRKGVK